MYRVFLPSSSNPAQVSLLQDLIPENIEVTNEEKRVDMVVCGRPTPAMLQACSPRVLLIPFAGVPPATIELMKRYPGIGVHNLHHNAPAAAETALCLMLAAARGITVADAALRRGDWSARYNPGTTLLLGGSRVLILGNGCIGRRLRRVCEALDAKVDAIRRTPDPDPAVHTPEKLHTLLGGVDFLVGCLPLTAETRGMIGSEELSLLHSRSIVVNVGRAEVFHEEALFSALFKGEIGGAGLDVWYRYPGDPSNTLPSRFPFHTLPSVVMSPHRGGAWGVPELERQRTEGIARAIRAGAKGMPVPHPVCLERGY
jgi:phosphoglycerate dehydrogenase-like enzyme